MEAWGQEVAAAAASGWRAGAESPRGGPRGERLTGEPLDKWGIPISGRIPSKSWAPCPKTNVEEEVS